MADYTIDTAIVQSSSYNVSPGDTLLVKEGASLTVNDKSEPSLPAILCEYAGDLQITLDGTVTSHGSKGISTRASLTLILGATGRLTALGNQFDGSPPKAVVASSLVDTIINGGLIQGDVDLQDGRDVYRGQGGTVLGLIDLGDGADDAIGGNGTERFLGGAGNDTLDGGGGLDTALFSGRRADYTLTQNADGSFTITDLRTSDYQEGTDQIRNIEFLQFSDQTLDLRPPAPPPPPQPGPVDQVLIGTKGKDVRVGGAGNDRLYGLSGNDTLTGGAGHDIFVFNTKLGSSKTDRKKNFDTLTDFSVADDTLWLDNKIFKKLGKAGALKKSYFTIGSKAKDKNDYLIYDKKKGVLSYDADGSGAGKAVEFAKLDKNLKLTSKDFLVV